LRRDGGAGLRCVVLFALLATAASGYANAGHADPSPTRAGPQQPQRRTLQGRVFRFQDVPSRVACLRMLPRLRGICERPFNAGSHMEVVIGDLDRDGRQDVVARYQSLFECGSHGCATEAYRGLRDGRFLKLSLNLASIGDVMRCRREASPGIYFTASRNQYCFPIYR
jgi:hypothetical protein